MKELKIDKEFEKLIPKLTDEEFNQLEENCKEHGIQDSIKIWSDENIIIDGHNRYKIAEKNNLRYETEYMSFENRNKVIEWMLINQLGRRNLNNYDRSLLALKLENLLKITVKEKEKVRKISNDFDNVVKVDSEKINTRKELSKIAGISEGTLNKVKHIEEKATPKQKEKLRAGETTVNKIYQEINPHISQNSGDNEWYTPIEYIESSRKVMGSIDLDPATSIKANKIVKAKNIYTINENGLLNEWYGNIFLNPPYSVDLINKFIDKLIEELKNINQCILLVNNATDTIWFQKIVHFCSGICFPKGRIKFYKPNSNKCSPLQGQCFLYFGINIKQFYSEFSKIGRVFYNER
jgi:ParB-like chromosome segregation protein Spo0J